MLGDMEGFDLYKVRPSHEVCKCTGFGFKAGYRARYQAAEGVKDPPNCATNGIFLTYFPLKGHS